MPYIMASVKSFEEQKYKNKELIIVYSKSEDTTEDYIKSIKSNNIKKISFEGNIYSSLNYGIKKASGKIIGKLGNKKEGILIREIDYDKIDTAREHWPFLRDRRVDFYKGILKNPDDD